MSSSSATFNPAVEHPATIVSASNRYTYCVRSIEFSNRKESYAIAESTIPDETVSLVFKVQTRPFEEMMAHVSENSAPLTSSYPYWTRGWIQRFDAKTETWIPCHDVSRSEHVKRMLININYPKSEELDSRCLVQISLFRKIFPNIDLRESACNIQYGFSSGNMNNIFESDMPTNIKINWA